MRSSFLGAYVAKPMRATSVDDATAEAYVARQLRTDPDLWVVEFESPDLLPPFDARIVD